MSTLPTSSEVVIIGGGIVGCAIAYHLAKRGVTDVVLLEQNQLTAGTTWHAAGLVGQLRASKNLTRLSRYTTELFSQLENEVGQSTGFKRTGSISLALNKERLEELLRQASTARAFGVDVNVLSPTDVLKFWPDISLQDVVGAVHIPGDGQTNPVDTTMALATGARKLGAQLLEHQEVLNILQDGEQVTGVETTKGVIQTKQVVIAAGMWSRQLAAKIGVPIPLQAAEHFYIVTEPMAAMKPGMPTLRVPDEQAYFKEDAGKLLLGAFELNAKPWSLDGVSREFAFGTLPEDLDHFAPILEQAVKRFPKLERVGIQLFFNGPESFTPDDRYLLGPTSQYDNLFVAAGFNSIGIQSSGGAGKVLADWMIDGHAPMSLFDVDIKRTFPFQANRQFLADRTTETLGLLYAMHWPERQFETARNTRTSPLHERLVASGAVMGELGGWERPNWYAEREAEQKTKAQYHYSYGKQNWFENCEHECLAIRDRVALFDQASYPIFVLKGRDATAVLNHISANNIDAAINQVVYTQWLNERGGIEADVTITRTDPNEFMIVSSCANEIQDFHWLTSHIPKEAHAIAFNQSSGLSMLGVMGPDSRALLQSISPQDLSSKGLPYYQSREIEIGYARVRINRLSYVGELGYELYIPTEFVAHVYEQIIVAGKPYGLTLAGFHAMNACRIEKSYKHMGHDIDAETSPFSAGLSFAVDMEKADFIGKNALAHIKRPLTQRLVNIAVKDDKAPRLIHDEPIYADGKHVGITTSGMWGHRVGCSLGIAALEHPEGVTRKNLSGTTYEIEIASKRFPIDVQLAPYYDPTSSRMKN